MPEPYDLGAEAVNPIDVGRHGMVREVASHHRAEPRALFRDGTLLALPQLEAYLATP